MELFGNINPNPSQNFIYNYDYHPKGRLLLTFIFFISFIS